MSARERGAYEALVIGAGIVGSACAWELARAGLSVGVLEGDTVGSGATAAGMGQIVVMDDSPAEMALTRYSQLLWDDLVRDVPERYEYTCPGTLWIAENEAEMAIVERKHAAYGAQDVPSTVLDHAALYALEPHLRPGLAGALRVPGDSVVYPPACAALLLERARALGATLIQQTAVHLVGGGVQMADGALVRGEMVVVANGARAAELAPELPVRPRKGHLAITDRYPDFIQHQLVELGYLSSAHAGSGDSVAFNVQPRKTGQLLIGSSRQLGMASAEIDQGILTRMLRRAIAYLPALERFSCLRIWTGLRAATPDGLPLIGPHPARPGVWLATGHEGLGITAALGTARLLADQVRGRAPAIAAEPYLPARLVREAQHA
jgi:glycine/D-amino acid oxidase-like deaminating enzyme